MGTELTVSEGLRLAIRRAGKSIAGISAELGFNQRASLSNMLNRGSMRADLMVEIAARCGYKVKLVNDAGDEIELGVSE